MDEAPAPVATRLRDGDGRVDLYPVSPGADLALLDASPWRPAS